MDAVLTLPAPGAGRFAPSPSGDLHVGNLRTALLAWLFARSTGRAFLLRVEDLDRVAAGAEERQLSDLAALGLDWDPPVVRQSARTDRYDAAVDALSADGFAYPCFCTRREIREAASAPQVVGDAAPAADLAYPGTCRSLTPADIADRVAAGRRPAWRLRAARETWTVADLLHGSFTGRVDDVVLRRNDGLAAYNLAVVVDDAAQGVDQVVRGDDLLTSAPRQAYLGHLLGLPPVTYAHVPLALNGDGRRLAKRDGAVTLADLAARGRNAEQVLAVIAASVGLTGTPQDMLDGFDPAALPAGPWIVDPALL
ncbi:tRNA glutamyl-Q(34) synthetase GluQRS [Nakamurella flavida]|uniref:tRNA glutamyl-Q(34) synthetase GluQRS n=1 Tax=Nakamurella flavida TaxID=363630 RepID=UPI0031DBE83B